MFKSSSLKERYTSRAITNLGIAPWVYSSYRTSYSLNVQEVESLMDELLKLPNPFTCPHGRPTAIKMTKYDLERKFSRR